MIIRQITVAMLALAAAPQIALAEGGAGGAAGGLASMVPLVLIMVIFYFLLIRPQQKRFKAHKTMISELKKGDKIITAGGVVAKVVDVQEEELKVEIADGVRVTVKRDTVTSLAD
ncbi:MAG: preprotein translocase subunit YajC [Mariprofundales bacterium]